MTMEKIKVFYGNEPCILEKDGYGLHRDRCPDSGWCELRYGIMSNVKEVYLTPELRKILIEDIAYYAGQNSKLFSELMDSFGLYDWLK